jgi:hypothetical protein
MFIKNDLNKISTFVKQEMLIPQVPPPPTKLRPQPSRAELDAPETPTKSKSLKQFFHNLEIVIHGNGK